MSAKKANHLLYYLYLIKELENLEQKLKLIKQKSMQNIMYGIMGFNQNVQMFFFVFIQHFVFYWFYLRRTLLFRAYICLKIEDQAKKDLGFYLLLDFIYLRIF